MKKILTLIAAMFMSATAFAGEFADISIADLKKAIAGFVEEAAKP